MMDRLAGTGRRGSCALAWARVFTLLLAWQAPTALAAGRHWVTSQNRPAVLARLAPVGSLPVARRLNLAISLPLRNQQELDLLLRQIYDPASSNYHHYLTPAQFTERFGPTTNDYQALMDFAKASGLAVTVTHPNRVVLDVEGTVADIQRTFHVNLRVYPHPSEARDFYAPDAEPSVDFAVPILQVSGLNDYSLPHPKSRIKPAGTSTRATAKAGSGPGGSYQGSDFRNAYVPGTTLTGAGQSVGLLQFDGFYSSDITTYESQAGLPNVPLTVVPIDGGVRHPGGGSSEVSLDIEMAISMAPGLAQVYVYEAPNPSPWVDLLSRMANDNLAKQLSCSWGGGSPDAAAEQIFQQMAAQGQSFFNASGDSDAFTGSIDFPSDSPNITQVGGTTLTTGTGASYQSETVWNWGLQSGSYVGSSGGISTYYAIPSYQQGLSMSANKGSTTMRNVPDVALTADNVYVVYGRGSTGTFGGTSCAAPLWAGFTALMNQQAEADGLAPVGFLNPALYAIGRGAGYAAAFHDTTTGNNFSSSSPNRFAAVPGYDLCTGWGTPKGIPLINALTLPPVPMPNIVTNSFTLVAEGCTNGVVDPAELVTVSFGLKNLGTANTTNLIVTLLPTGGILTPSAPQVYGVLSTNGTAAARPFTFTAAGSCGNTNTATLQLQDGPANLGTLTFPFRLGLSSVINVFAENFDGVATPALPAGWATSSSGAESPWVTTTSSRDTAPNSVFAPDPSNVGLSELDSPTFTLPVGQAQLSFRHYYNLESTYDGGVLEINIGGAGWADILAAGGSFVSGGYVTTLSSQYSSPLAGRSAWTGNSGGFITTVVNLPASAAGQSIQLRWRCGSDNSVSATGWYVDTVAVTSSSFACCTALPASITLQPTSQTAITGGNVSFQVKAAGTAPLTYQWWFDGTNLPGAVNATLTLTNVQPAQQGIYAVLVANGYGSVLSSNAVLTVLGPPTIKDLSLTGTGVSITFPSQLGLSYVLEYKHSLNDPTWTPLAAAVSGTGGAMVLQDTNAPADRRFYRLLGE